MAYADFLLLTAGPGSGEPRGPLENAAEVERAILNYVDWSRVFFGDPEPPLR